MPLTQKLIESKTLTSGAALVTFSAIPSTYDHLLFRTSVRTTRFSDGYADVSFYANGVNTGTGYISGGLSVHGGNTPNAIPFSGGNTTSYFLMSSVVSSVSNYQYYFGDGYILIPNYRVGNVKVGKYESYAPPWVAGQGIHRQGVFSWNDANAITSITFKDENGTTMVAGSTFDLYGLVNS